MAGYPSNESSYVSSRYSNKSTPSGDSGLGSSERARGSGLLGSSSRVSGHRGRILLLVIIIWQDVVVVYSR